MHGQGFPRGFLLLEFAANMFHVQRRDRKEHAVQQFGRREPRLQIHADAFAKNRGSRPADAERLEQRSAAGPDLCKRNAGIFGRYCICKRRKFCCVSVLLDESNYCCVMSGHEAVKTGFVEERWRHTRFSARGIGLFGPCGGFLRRDVAMHLRHVDGFHFLDHRLQP